MLFCLYFGAEQTPAHRAIARRICKSPRWQLPRSSLKDRVYAFFSRSPAKALRPLERAYWQVRFD
jgi:hypothetical protein